MKVIDQASELRAGHRKVCVAMGVFDGVHLGHQQVIRQTISDARQHGGISMVLTFDRHPNSVVAPARTPLLIQTLPQKIAAIQSLGADACLVLPFTKELSQIPAVDFIRNLVRELGGILSICVGGTFTFGYKRSGDVALLRNLGGELGFQVHGLAAVSLDGRIVSSTRIREVIRSGDLDAASQMMGRSYALSGKVVAGRRLGRTIGFPTANIEATGLTIPPNGVYAAHARVDTDRHPAAVNIGVRPTVEGGLAETSVEAHLIDFSGDLYGKTIELEFVENIRPEQKFPSLEALKAQIQKDTETARGILAV